jgi:nucleotide-binding universal stress UspA family protein
MIGPPLDEVALRRALVADTGTPRTADAAALAAQLARAPEAARTVELHGRSIGHRAARDLADEAHRDGADLIVLGSRADAPDGRVWPTRTTMRLLHDAPCAVAVAPAGYEGTGPFRHLGVAFDGSPEADAALAAAYGLAERDASAVTLYRIMVDGRPSYAGIPEVDRAWQLERVAAQEQLDAAADRAPAGVNPETVLLRGSPARAIAAAADGVLDLVITGSRGQGPMARAFAGSTSESLLLSATCPVLIIPRASSVLRPLEDPRNT